MKRQGLRKASVTIRDVASESGFAASTVSIVLNNAPLARYIPPATKARIHKAAKKLGYHPNIFAKSLRSKSCARLHARAEDYSSHCFLRSADI